MFLWKDVALLFNSNTTYKKLEINSAQLYWFWLICYLKWDCSFQNQYYLIDILAYFIYASALHLSPGYYFLVYFNYVHVYFQPAV